MKYSPGLTAFALSLALMTIQLSAAESDLPRRPVHPRPDPQSERAFYFGITIPYNQIGGDFDGDLALVDGDQIVYLPDVKSNGGLGLVAGLRAGRSDAEISYSISFADSKTVGISRKARYYAFSVDYRLYLLSGSPVRPFLQGGGGVVKLVVEDGSEPVDPDTYDIGDSRFTDFELHPGAGLAWFPSKDVSLRLSAVYRLITFDFPMIDGTAGSIDPPRGIKGNELCLSFGLVLIL